MKSVAGCLITIVIYIVVGAIINALLAWPISWALNAFTPWHLTWLTVFVVLCIISVVFGGGRAANNKK